MKTEKKYCFSIHLSSQFLNHAQSKTKSFAGCNNPSLKYSVILFKSYRSSGPLINYWSFHFFHIICHVYNSCEPASWKSNLVLRMIEKVAYLWSKKAEFEGGLNFIFAKRGVEMSTWIQQGNIVPKVLKSSVQRNEERAWQFRSCKPRVWSAKLQCPG